jgi:hypothetical protein
MMDLKKDVPLRLNSLAVRNNPTVIKDYSLNSQGEPLLKNLAAKYASINSVLHFFFLYYSSIFKRVVLERFIYFCILLYKFQIIHFNQIITVDQMNT